MTKTDRRPFVSVTFAAKLAFALAFSGLQPVLAADAPEPQHLAALVRQLELAERLTAHAAASASQAPARYHFDYTRLRADLQRIRAGIHDYLVPHRAQPRDLVPLIGDYTREAPREAAR